MPGQRISHHCCSPEEIYNGLHDYGCILLILTNTSYNMQQIIKYGFGRVLKP